ncbi:MAG TPA: hypothetical protein VGN34_05860, partial [Ktedonobacteraceae bacterium]
AKFRFAFQWDDFLWSLIAVNTTDMRTMPIGLTLFNQEYFALFGKRISKKLSGKVCRSDTQHVDFLC